ncbi:retrovirus-related pol polyprotein from transposon TNT 1-94 [Tanacetum coccineum]
MTYWMITKRGRKKIHDLQLIILCGGMFKEILSQGEALKIVSFMETIVDQQKSSKATNVTKPKAAKVTKPAGDPATKKRKLVKETRDDPFPAKRLKAGLVGKRRKAKSPLRLIDEPSDEGVPVEEPAHNDEEADLQQALELSLKEQGE